MTHKEFADLEIEGELVGKALAYLNNQEIVEESLIYIQEEKGNFEDPELLENIFRNAKVGVLPSFQDLCCSEVRNNIRHIVVTSMIISHRLSD